MARTPNKPRAKAASPAARIWGNVAKARSQAGLTEKEVAAAMGISAQTFKVREKEPENLTLGELQQLSILLGTDFENLVNITW